MHIGFRVQHYAEQGNLKIQASTTQRARSCKTLSFPPSSLSLPRPPSLSLSPFLSTLSITLTLSLSVTRFTRSRSPSHLSLTTTLSPPIITVSLIDD